MSVIEGLSKEELEELNNLYTVKEFKRNEIISQRDYNKISIRVLDGILRKYIVKDANEKTVDLYLPKDLIVSPNIDYQPIYPYKIQALKKSVVGMLDMEGYSQWKNKPVNILKMDLQIMESALEQNMYRLETFQFMNATERYLDLLKRNPLLIQQVPLLHIASYLGINNASLSKIRASLKKEAAKSV